MKINSEHLWKYINELATNEKVKFNVYYDDQYVTQIYWNGESFEWEPGTFTSEAFFNPLYDFVVIEEEIELNSNSVEFNINVDKRDCVITLDENDLGIDKLHLENCYFYKENDKWYVKKYDFKNFNLEEKKIPEKFKINYEIDEENTINMEKATMLECDLACRINEIIDYLDYLKSKGE